MDRVFKTTFLKISCLLFAYSVFSLFFYNCCFAADLDGLYGQLIKKSDFLYEAQFYYFEMQEQGFHGSGVYGDFDSRPYYYSLGNLIRFAPWENLELTLGFTQSLPSGYSRSTDNIAGNLAVVQQYGLEYFRDYTFDLRLRHEPVELYLEILEKNQKTDWNSALLPAQPDYFNYIITHYEDFKAGVRYLNSSKEQDESNLSKITRPLLNGGQLNLELELGYKKGALRRNGYYYGPSFVFLNYYHRLKPQFIPQLIFRGGLDDNLEIESGVSYTSPFKYNFKYEAASGGLRSWTEGNYRLDNKIQFPVRLRYRPQPKLEVMLASDINVADQKLYYWKVASNGVVTDYPTKKLSYFNTQPTLTISYLYDNNKKIEPSVFSLLTKELLLQGQCLFTLKYQKDLTSLDKNAANAAQNIIDPYNVFMYPLDYFAAGSEYATFFTGNNSGAAANVLPQNYYLYHFKFNYGLIDKLNVGLGAGYHSSSHLHHFTLGNSSASSYDMKNRFYKFKPYYFFDSTWDWQPTQNSIVTFAAYFVPEYETTITIYGHPQDFKTKDRYFVFSLDLKLLF